MRKLLPFDTIVAKILTFCVRALKNQKALDQKYVAQKFGQNSPEGFCYFGAFLVQFLKKECVFFLYWWYILKLFFFFLKTYGYVHFGVYFWQSIDVLLATSQDSEITSSKLRCTKIWTNFTEGLLLCWRLFTPNLPKSLYFWKFAKTCFFLQKF